MGEQVQRGRVRHLDERFLEGRRRRILEEHQHLQELNERKANVVVVGAGFMGVQWACELRYFFSELSITITDFLPRCLGSLPEEAAKYCQDYMESHKITTRYMVKYNPEKNEFWEGKVKLNIVAD